MEKINLLSYFEQIAKKNGISSDNVINRLKDAINSTYSKNFPGKNIKIDIDTNKNALEIIELYNVVNDHDDLDDYNEIAVETIKGYKVGEVYQKKVDLSKLPTNILQMFVKTFLRGVVADSNIQTYNAWNTKVGTVEKFEVEERVKGGNYKIKLNNEMYGILPVSEQVPREILKPGEKYFFYIKDVKHSAVNDWPVILSRVNQKLVIFLLGLNIPEIQDKSVEIKKIVRIPGYKTKIVVQMNQSFATIGSLIGDGAIRVKSIQKDLGGERVEIIEYSDDLSVFIPNVASPTPILGYTFEEVNGHKNITIVTYEDKVSLLLDRRGYNVKIISTILGANIDVISGPKAKEEGINYQPITRSFKKKTMDDNVDTKKAVSNFISDDD